MGAEKGTMRLPEPMRAKVGGRQAEKPIVTTILGALVTMVVLRITMIIISLGQRIYLGSRIAPQDGQGFRI